MKETFRKLFNIYPGEEKSALSFALLAFLWSFAVTSGWKFSDALFLLHVGADSLPTAYAIAACIMIVLASFLLYAFHRFNPSTVFKSVLTVGVLFYCFAYFCLINDYGVVTKWIWYALRIFGSVFFAVVVTSFWTFIDQYHHLQDAKRLYALFSSMVFLGVATTGTVMRSGLIEFQELTLVIIVLLVLTVGIINAITKRIQPVHDESASDAGAQANELTLLQMIRSILSSKFTLLLMTGNFITYLLLVITEFNYLSSFDQHFDPTNKTILGEEQEATLTLFLGQWLAIVSITNFLFGIFIYSRWVRRFGIESVLPITPIILMITFSGWLGSNSLLFPIMGLFVVEGTLYVVDDSNFNILLNAVPTKLKYKIRIAIESFFEPIGMLISSLLLSSPFINSRMLGLVLATCSLAIALTLRKQYIKAIYRNLAENALHFNRSIAQWFFSLSRKQQEGSEDKLLATLQNGEEKSQVLAAQALLGSQSKEILYRFLKCTDKLPDQMKINLLKLIEQSIFFKDEHVVYHLLYWLKHSSDQTLKNEISFYLAKLDLLPSEEMIDDLHSGNLTIKATAILSLRNDPQAIQELDSLLQSGHKASVCMGLEILGIIGESKDIERLLFYVQMEKIKIARKAAESIAKLANEHCKEYVPYLIQSLAKSDTEIRCSIITALGMVGDLGSVKGIILASENFRPNEKRLTEKIITRMGIDSVPVLLQITGDPTVDDYCRILAGRILGGLKLSTLRDNLYDILDSEIERAYFYFYYSKNIQKMNPDIDLSMLSEALYSSYRSVLDFIIQLLAVAGEVEDCELLSHSLRSKNPKVRSHVVETLERTCEHKIFRLVYPLVSDTSDEEKFRIYLRDQKDALSLSQLLDKMTFSSLELDQIIAATFKYRLKLSNWKESLLKDIDKKELYYQQFAKELLQT